MGWGRATRSAAAAPALRLLEAALASAGLVPCPDGATDDGLPSCLPAVASRIPGEALRPGLLWVAEQVPGLVAAADMTDMLAFGYWPSFNVPFFPEVGAAACLPV